MGTLRVGTAGDSGQCQHDKRKKAPTTYCCCLLLPCLALISLFLSLTRSLSLAGTVIVSFLSTSTSFSTSHFHLPVRSCILIDRSRLRIDGTVEQRATSRFLNIYLINSMSKIIGGLQNENIFRERVLLDDVDTQTSTLEGGEQPIENFYNTQQRC